MTNTDREYPNVPAYFVLVKFMFVPDLVLIAMALRSSSGSLDVVREADGGMHEKNSISYLPLQCVRRGGGTMELLLHGSLVGPFQAESVLPQNNRRYVILYMGATLFM